MAAGKKAWAVGWRRVQASTARVVQEDFLKAAQRNITTNFKGDGQECPSHTFLSSSEEVVGYYGAFDANHQSHNDTFCFVMVRLVQKVHGAQAGSEAQGRPSGLSADAARDKRTHDGIGFAVSLLEAALSGKGVGGNQAGKNPSVDLGFKCPEMMLAGGVGQWRAGRYKVLCRCGGGE